MAVLFDTLQMVETLQAGGFTDQQARAMTTALGNAATVAQVATRGDVMDLGVGMKHDFDALRTELEAHRADTNHRIEAAMKDMTIRLGGIAIACSALLVAAQHFWR